MQIMPFVTKGLPPHRFCLPAFSRLNTNINSLLSPSGYFAEEAVFEANLSSILSAYARHLQAKAVTKGELPTEKKPILLAMDDLPLARKHLKKVIQKLNDLGLDVYTCYYHGEGYLPVPLGTAAYVTKYFSEFNKFHNKLSGALVLTSASHPLSKIGFRFLNTEGMMYTTAEMKALDSHFLPASESAKNSQVLTNKRGQEYHFDFTRGNYYQYLRQLVNYKKLKRFSDKLFYSPLHGALKIFFNKYLSPYIQKYIGTHYVEDLINDISTLKNGSSINASNITPLTREIQQTYGCHKAGLITNGDGSAMRVINNNAALVLPDEINALFIWHLIENRRRDGIIIKTQDTGQIIDDVAARYGLRVIEVPVGFHYVGEAAKQHNKDTLLLGIDGQGGVSPVGHIPIKDGLLGSYLVLEMLGESGMKLEKLLLDLKAALKRDYIRNHTQLFCVDTEKVMGYFKALAYSHQKLGALEVDRKRSIEQIESFKKHYHLYPQQEVKVFFKDDSWLLARINKSKANTVDVWVEVCGDVVKRRWLSDKNYAQSKYRNFKESLIMHINKKLGVDIGQNFLMSMSNDVIKNN